MRDSDNLQINSTNKSAENAALIEGIDCYGNERQVLHEQAKFFNNPWLSDIVIRVGEEKYHAHKLVLVRASEVFERMLSDDWNEADKELVLIEEKECATVFTKFLKYLYGCHIVLNAEDALPILVLADKYNVTDLRQVAIHYAINNLIPRLQLKDLFHIWFQYATKCYHTALIMACIAALADKMDDITSLEEWRTEWNGLDRDQMIEILKCSDLVIKDEYQLWQAVERWLIARIQKDKARAIHLLTDVLPYVRFPAMTSDQLSELERTSKLVQSYPTWFAPHLASAYKFHAMPLGSLAAHFNNHTIGSNNNTANGTLETCTSNGQVPCPTKPETFTAQSLINPRFFAAATSPATHFPFPPTSPGSRPASRSSQAHHPFTNTTVTSGMYPYAPPGHAGNQNNTNGSSKNGQHVQGMGYYNNQNQYYGNGTLCAVNSSVGSNPFTSRPTPMYGIPQHQPSNGIFPYTNSYQGPANQNNAYNTNNNANNAASNTPLFASPVRTPTNSNSATSSPPPSSYYHSAQNGGSGASSNGSYISNSAPCNFNNGTPSATSPSSLTLYYNGPNSLNSAHAYPHGPNTANNSGVGLNYQHHQPMPEMNTSFQALNQLIDRNKPSSYVYLLRNYTDTRWDKRIVIANFSKIAKFAELSFWITSRASSCAPVVGWDWELKVYPKGFSPTNEDFRCLLYSNLIFDQPRSVEYCLSLVNDHRVIKCLAGKKNFSKTRYTADTETEKRVDLSEILSVNHSYNVGQNASILNNNNNNNANNNGDLLLNHNNNMIQDLSTNFSANYINNSPPNFADTFAPFLDGEDRLTLQISFKPLN